MLDMAIMSAQLALDLDHDAIRLLSHQSDGWVVEGVVELASADFSARIAGLHQRAEDLAGGPPDVLLVLPRSEILYTRFEGLTDPDSELPAELEAITPYRADEMTWDNVAQGDETVVAAVALETLDEAVAFATSSQFRVAGLTSEPPEGLFPRMPVFRRARDGARPLVLEPAAPPARRTVAFSGNRNADYAPKPTKPLSDRARGAVAPIVAALLALPKPAIFAFTAFFVAIVAFALRPEIDPDRFARGAVDLSFTELPVAMVEERAGPTVGTAPIFPTGPEAVTILRDTPPIAVPVVLDTSPVAADYLADVSPASAFERVARAPALFGETRLPQPLVRPSAARAPAFPPTDAPGTDRVARVAEPALLPGPPTTDSYAAPNAVEAAAPARVVAALTSDAAAPDALFQPEPMAVPALVAEAPDPGAAPASGPAPDVASADASDETPVLRLAALPPGSALAAAPPDAALALLPPQSDDAFELGPDGFVTATPEGTLTPGGVLAIASAPPVVSPARPREVAPEPELFLAAAPEPDTPSPAPRIENPNPELAAVLPRPRPREVEARVVAELTLAPAPEVPDSVIAEALQDPEPVLAASLLPRPRPDLPAASVQTAAATRAAPAAPRIPSRANVAREATIEDALPLNRLNLIGVYGSANDRRALVRLPSGRFVKLKVGDRLDGGQVAQIGPDRLIYQKGGRALAISMPNT